MPDLVRVYMLVSERPMGRTSLIRETDLGEASVKTMLKHLKSEGLIQQGSRGAEPTEKWRRLFSFCNRFSKAVPVEVHDFSERFTFAVCVRNPSGLTTGIEQRDEGIKYGSRIMTFLKKHGKLALAGVDENPPEGTGNLPSECGEGDAVIVSAARERLPAMRGLLAAALTLV